MKIKKGDKVQITLGKDHGKTVTVDRVLGKQNKVFIAGANVVKRHVKKYGEMQGGVIELSKPINISNVMLVCPNCNKPTRVGYNIEGDKKFRVCKRCQKEIK